MSSLRSSRAYSNLQVESIRWQRSALPPGSTGSFLILNDDGVVTFGTDAILNSLTLKSLTVTQGITTGSLAVLGSITAQNVDALKGTIGALRVTGNLIVEGATIVPSGASVVEALYIFAGATNVPLSGFQGYNLDVSGSAIFRGGLTMGGPLVATNSVIVRGATAQMLIENATGVTVGSIQGLASGLYIESNQAVKFSNLDESAGDLLTIDPVSRLVTVGSGVTLNVRGIGGAGVTVSAPTVFTGPVTTNGNVTMNGLVTVSKDNTLKVLGVIDAQGGIKHSDAGGILNLNDSVAVAGPLFVQGVVQQGDAAMGSGKGTLQLQPTEGPVTVGNAGATVTVVGPLATNQGVIVGGGMTVTGRIVGSGGLTTTTGYFSGGVTVAGGLTTTTGYFSSGVTMAGALTATTGYFSSGLTVSGSIVATQGVSGTTAVFTSGMSTNTIQQYSGSQLEIAPAGAVVTIGNFSASDGIIANQVLSMNKGAYVTGLYGFQVGPIAAGSLTAPIDGSGAVFGWNSVEAGSGNLEVILGQGGIATGGGLNVWNTATVSGTTANTKIVGVDRSGNLSLAGGVTATTGYFSSGVTVTGLLTAASGVTATTGYFSSGVTMVGNISSNSLNVANTANVGALNTPIITNGTPGNIQVDSILQVSYGIKSISGQYNQAVGINIQYSGFFIVSAFYPNGPNYYGVCQGIYINLNTGTVPVTIISQSGQLTFTTDTNTLYITNTTGYTEYSLTYISTF